MRIGLSYDLKEAITIDRADGDDALEEYDSLETLELIATSLEAGGHSLVMLGGGREFLENILHEKVDFVFNIAEGRGNYCSREAQVPSVLEMLDIPYSGSDPQCLAICLDKPLTKKLVASAGVHTPKWCVVNSSQELSQIAGCGFPFPAIVKPACEGSSKGIRLTSIAYSAKQAQEEAQRIIECYHQPAMVEEYIAGDEVTIGLVGNNPAQIIGVMRVVPKERNDHFIYSVEVKRDYLNLVDYECPALIGKKILDMISNSSLSVFKALGCRDFARLDFRVNPEGIPYFIEINPLPGLGTYSDLVIMAIKMGWTHETLIYAVFNAAMERYPHCVHV